MSTAGFKPLLPLSLRSLQAFLGIHLSIHRPRDTHFTPTHHNDARTQNFLIPSKHGNVSHFKLIIFPAGLKKDKYCNACGEAGLSMGILKVENVTNSTLSRPFGSWASYANTVQEDGEPSDSGERKQSKQSSEGVGFVSCS